MAITLKIAEPADAPLLLQLTREYYEFDYLPFDERLARSALVLHERLPVAQMTGTAMGIGVILTTRF